jgi:hypothetical protein
MGFGGRAPGEVNAIFGGAAKLGRGGGAATGRETGVTGAGMALIGAAMGGDVLGARGVERRDRSAFGADNGAGSGKVRAAILGRGLALAVKFVGAGGATWRVVTRAGSMVTGIFSFERGMPRGGGANSPLCPPPAAGRRAMVGREGRGAVLRYKSGRFCSGPSASSTPRSTLTVGLPY